MIFRKPPNNSGKWKKLIVMVQRHVKLKIGLFFNLIHLVSFISSAVYSTFQIHFQTKIPQLQSQHSNLILTFLPFLRHLKFHPLVDLFDCNRVRTPRLCYGGEPALIHVNYTNNCRTC